MGNGRQDVGGYEAGGGTNPSSIAGNCGGGAVGCACVISESIGAIGEADGDGAGSFGPVGTTVLRVGIQCAAGACAAVEGLCGITVSCGI